MVILPLTSWSLQTFQQNSTFQLKHSDFGGKNTRNTMLRGFCYETNLNITAKNNDIVAVSVWKETCLILENVYEIFSSTT